MSQSSAKKGKIVKKKFTQEEDNLLIQLIESYGEKSFQRISNIIPGRTARQCRERWKYYLQPKLTNDEWSDEEDEELKRLFDFFGPQWAQISRIFGNRSSIHVRNRYRKVIRREVKKNKKMENKYTNEQNDAHQYHILIEIPLPVSRLLLVE